jgi:uncharacterized membrane protein
MAFCGNCGAVLTQEAGFCGACGKPVAAVNQAPAPAPAGAAAITGPDAGWKQVAAPPVPSQTTPSQAGWAPVAAQPAAAPGAAQPPIGAQAGYAPVSAQPAPALAVAPVAGPGLTSNQAAALSYALGFITGVIFLVLDPFKQDRFVRFHAMQSIIYSAAAIVFSIAWRIAVGILIHISPWLALASIPIRLLIMLGLFLLWLFVIYQAYSGRTFRIPIIGAIAANQAG